MKLLSVLLVLQLSVPAMAAVSQLPLFLTQSVDPRVMLVMSNDHQLSVKAYTDYSDLDGDGTLDTTYTDAIEYSGYFDSGKCYTYANSRFEPIKSVEATPATTPVTPTMHQCAPAATYWSGNFLNWASMTRMDMVRKVLYGGLRATGGDTNTLTVLERAFLPRDVHAFSKVFRSADVNKYTPNTGAAITICNFTDASSGLSKDVTAAPVLRVAAGYFPRWAAQETSQCVWDPGASVHIPDSGTDYVARVQVCVSGLEEDNCNSYGNNQKPTGLLQDYGEDSNSRPIRFGLMSGSYAKNKSGGVLRRNLERITGHTGTDAVKNEIDTDTGIFINQGATAAGIINTLNRFRISSYNYTGNRYASGCGSAGLTSFSDGSCVDWGNPLSEIYLETLRYLSGKTAPTAAFDAFSASLTNKDSSFINGLTKVDWVDPMPANEYCADTSILTLSTGLNSFDTDQLTGHGLTGLDADVATNLVGADATITGNYLVGKGTSVSLTDKQCTAKQVDDLADVEGICPEVPSMEGGYHLAGLAYHARTEDLRASSDYIGDQTLTTYGVSLAESLPRFDVGTGSNIVTILPACRARKDLEAWRDCSMTDLIVESYSATAGSFLVNWEDSAWGGDFDMDGIARIEYCVGPAACDDPMAYTTIGADSTAGTNDVRIKVAAVQAFAGHQLQFGYTISGAGQLTDGLKLLINRPGGANFLEGTTPLPAGVDQPNTTTYIPNAISAKQLKNPLWYAAKYGGFNDTDNDSMPNLDLEWDKDLDGTPDTYFQVTNPGELTKSLGAVLSDVAGRVGSASAVTSNSTSLNTSAIAFQALFNSADWSGELKAMPINSDGSVGGVIWNAAANIPVYGDRNIFAWDPVNKAGVSFEIGNRTLIKALAVSAATASLNPALASAAAASLGDDQINYLRGDVSKEDSKAGGRFRDRTLVGGSPLGDVINSDPLFVKTANLGYTDLPGAEGTSYPAHLNTTDSRTSMLYVGGNDGMLHAFSFDYTPAVLTTPASVTGTEKFNFIPNAVFGNLATLTNPGYRHNYFVDGSAVSSDAYIAPGAGNTTKTWRTVLVGTTGAGGKGIFALDITDPDNFSASNVLWDFDSNHGSFGDLGYTLGEATIARMPDGHFYAIFGNGYQSSSGRAVLYAVNLNGSNTVLSIILESSSGTNGLSSPLPVDTDGDNIVDAIYAGDLLGNMWKVEMNTGVSPVTLVSAFPGVINQPPVALFTATQTGDATVRQPITAQPEAGRNDEGDTMVYFGTGKYFELGDNDVSTPKLQSFYGIRDNGSQVVRANLIQQTIDAEDSTTFALSTGLRVRLTSNKDVDYTGSAEGWFMDLGLFDSSDADPANHFTATIGERVTNQPILRGDRVIFTTLIPAADACSFGGSSWLMEIDAQTGSRLPETPIDSNGDGAFTYADKVSVTLNGVTALIAVSGFQKPGLGIFDNPAILEDGKKEVKVLGGSSGGIDSVLESKSNPSGRQSWQQLQ
tara:strand:+ start:2837 stop:7273 length:4437 start_codon:yes stop_codon:yes gene_type:complete